MPIFIIAILVQIFFVLHIIKTGRNTTWIWIVVMLPLAGSIAYFIIELLPDLLGSRSGRKAQSNLGKVINPNKDIKQAARNYSISNTIDNSTHLADEYLNKGMFTEAKDLYAKSLRGIHQYDPEIMRGLANAEFGLSNYTRVKEILDRLIKENPDYKNADGHLLYAKALEQLGETELALQEFKILDKYFSGPEASYRYAILLKINGNTEESTEVIERILHDARYAGKHYNSIYKKWVKLAKYEAKSLES